MTISQIYTVTMSQSYQTRNLTDIETTSELTGESRTKLAQAKSKGLVRTLISEALTLNKTWEDIKNSLRLKICISDIHTSISHFMEIQ